LNRELGRREVSGRRACPLYDAAAPSGDTGQPRRRAEGPDLRFAAFHMRKHWLDLRGHRFNVAHSERTTGAATFFAESKDR